MQQRILFIGNSFTYYNDLPKMLEILATAAGKEVLVDSVTKGGWYLHAHIDPRDEIGAKVAQKLQQPWECIVLQEQSLNAVKDFEDYRAAVKGFAECCDPKTLYLYQTWSYEAGSEKLQNTGLTFEEMSAALQKATARVADEIGANVVPVGEAAFHCIREHPEIPLYCDDHFHPAPALTYLAACKFCRELLQLDPLTLITLQEINEADALILRQIAAI